ncbi:MAG TPA: PRC-barrel domain-containing protein [Dissulfurispiraceae bacterium]
MKTSILSIMLAVSLVFGMTTFAAAQGGMYDQGGATNQSGLSSERGMTDQSTSSTYGTESTRGAMTRTDTIIKADDLSGKTIQDRSGADIGTVSSVALDTLHGTAYVLVSMDNKLHPIPISALQKTDSKYSVSMDRNTLAQSPSFTESMMKQQLANRTFDTSVYRFFGMTPPWGGGKQMRH